MFQYTKTTTGYRFNGGDQWYEARKVGSKWDLYRNAEPGWAVNSSTVWELVAEGYATRDAAARDAYDMDNAAITARRVERERVEAETPNITALRAEFRFKSGGSQRAIHNHAMSVIVEEALREAVEAERTRVWRELTEAHETVMGSMTSDGEPPRAVVRIRSKALRTLLWGDR